MKLAKVFEYLKTLAKVKRNFLQECVNELPENAEKLAGRAEAYDDMAREIESIEMDLMPEPVAQQTQTTQPKPFWDNEAQGHLKH
jgi:hypothetical protein